MGESADKIATRVAQQSIDQALLDAETELASHGEPSRAGLAARVDLILTAPKKTTNGSILHKKEGRQSKNSDF